MAPEDDDSTERETGMTDATNEPTGGAAAEDAAREAAQNVVDEVTSWNYSAERETVEGQLDEGLDEAGVELADGERSRVLEELDALKQDETRGAPRVESAEPSDGS